MRTEAMDSSTAQVAVAEGVDPCLTLALAQASIAAYADYKREQVVPPENYRLVARWTGWDASILGGQEERFGLLFQTTLPGEKIFIFAFRGTDSALDIYEDLFFNTVPFTPYEGKVSPTPYVASGFYDIYDGVGGSMTQSMRQQVFSLLAKHQPSRVYLTGHSLGGALSQLFSLDLAVSSPHLWAANMNFASPMVGTSDWQAAYQAQAAEQDPGRKTVRVYNYWDYVPSLPPALFNYTHVGRGFRTSFYVQSEWYPHVFSRHSILNLQKVLQHAVWRDPQVWAGTFQDPVAPSREIKSTVPPSGVDVRWVEVVSELQKMNPTSPDRTDPLV